MRKTPLAFYISFLSILCVSAEDATDISVELSEILEGSNVPALAAAAVVDGKIVSVGAAGFRKNGDQTQVTIDDKFHIGSCTKSMTATLGAMLVQSGEIEWGTTVSNVFPGIKIHKDFKDVTFKQLLTNTGGTPKDIESNLWQELWKRKGTKTEQRMLLAKGTLENPPTYTPGSQQLYSNTGFAIAGAMIETTMKKSFEDLLTTMLFKPLTMDSAGFRAPARKGKVDQPYGHVDKFFMVMPVDPEPKGDNPPAIAPAGAVHCSITDLAKYALLHLGKSNKRLLSNDSLKLLHTPDKDQDYAMGWVVRSRKWAGGKALTHTGSNTMFYAVIWLAPERNFAAVAMCNYGGSDGFEKCDEAIRKLIKIHL